jgi:hypothetical protein
MEITLEMLQQKTDETIEAIAAIKEQIARAKSNAAQHGDYSDSDWFHSANRALRHKQAEHQLLLRETAKVRQKNKQESHVLSEKQRLTFERTFMQVAKQMLDDATYTMLLRATSATTPT